MRSPQRHSNMWMTAPVSEITTALTCRSFSLQKRQVLLAWSTTVAIFSARNNSMALPNGKAGQGEYWARAKVVIRRPFRATFEARIKSARNQHIAGANPHRRYVLAVPHKIMKDIRSLVGEIGGRGGIRTHGTLAGTPVFKTGALNHSATLPNQ
jgi:hypothetical protein